jgi:predicted alpha-1,2-mannosidase
MMNTTAPVDYVNLFIGTAGDHGQLYPGAEMPFGLVKLAPDTFPGAVTGSAHAGYDYDDRWILGFSHLRFSGVGNRGVGGNILLLPTLSSDALDPASYSTPYDKASERVSPGYYRVVLGEPGIEAELTATEHVGVHRYTFPGGTQPHVLIDLGRSFTKMRHAYCVISRPIELTGEITCEQMRPSGYYRLFFCIRFQQTFEEVRLFPGGQMRDACSLGGDGTLVAVARFCSDNAVPLMVKVGLSCISVGQARRDLEYESPEWDFDGIRERCRRSWARTLGRIEVAGEREYQDLFYTHLYRGCLSPFNVTSSVGTYMDNDGEVHSAHDSTRYNGWSNWDTYRTKFPLLTLVEPARMSGMMHSLADTLARTMHLDPGVPRGEVRGFHPVPTVRLDMSNVILLDAYQKGIECPDPLATYAVMREIVNREFAPELDRLGFVPRRPDRTCEYAYDSWAVAAMARALGRDDDARLFGARARYWRNTWDEDVCFLRARDEDGSWLEFPEDPAAVIEKHVYEGSMWHWRWAVVHAVNDLVQLMGGHQCFVEQLTYFFEHDLHNHGNQPGIHAAWLFAAVGAPWLSQKWVRRVLAEPMLQRYGTHGFLPEPFYGRIYRSEPEGFIPEMDDDDGCMAAWYVFSSMGLFPLCPGRPLYTVGTPLFEEIVIHNESGRDFRILTKGLGKDSWYVQSACLNGEAFNRPWIWHHELIEGGLLEFEVGPQPSKTWGATSDLPW